MCIFILNLVNDTEKLFNKLTHPEKWKIQLKNDDKDTCYLPIFPITGMVLESTALGRIWLSFSSLGW